MYMYKTNMKFGILVADLCIAIVYKQKRQLNFKARLQIFLLTVFDIIVYQFFCFSKYCFPIMLRLSLFKNFLDVAIHAKQIKIK
jgi:hypothetical protein